MAETTNAGKLIKLLRESTKDRKKQLIEEFAQKFHLNSEQIRDTKYKSQLLCPYCHTHGHIVNFGYTDTTKTRRRFHCKNCVRHFNDHTDTLFHNKKLRNHILLFLELMLEGASIRKIAAYLSISPTTVNSWRQSVLRYIEKSMEKFMNTLYTEEIIEVSVREFKPSRKGLSIQRCQVPNHTQVVQFHCDRRNHFHVTLHSEAGIKPRTQMIKGNTYVYLAGTLVTACMTSPADRLLYHSENVKKLDEHFAASYRRMRGVSQPNLIRYALWQCLLSHLNRLHSKERLQSLLLLCI